MTHPTVPARRSRRGRLLLAAATTLLVGAGLLPTTSASADTTALTDDKNVTVPTTSWVFQNLGTSSINSLLTSRGARLTDVEPANSAGTLFTGRMVRNAGAYGVSGWWWYVGLTGSQVSTKLTENGARLIDVEPYVVSGTTRYAVVMVKNSGTAAREWYWGAGSSSSAISNHLSSKGTRLIDLNAYVDAGGVKRYAFISVKNAGTDAKTWYWYLNQTPASLSTKLKDTGSRLMHLDRQPDGTYNAIMVRNVSGDAAAWWWYVDLPLSTALQLEAQQVGRITDIEQYVVGGVTRVAVVMIDNANSDTRYARGVYGSFFNNSSGNPKGIHEGYLEDLNGSARITLNPHRQTEVASSLKVLHLLHSLRRVQAGADTVTATNFRTYHYGTGSVINANNVCPEPSQEGSSASSLGTVRAALQRMIRSSNNADTRGVVLRYRTSTDVAGQYSVFNDTAAAYGMESTRLRNDIGCGLRNGGNLTTAEDLATAYEKVHKGQVLDPATRSEFWATYGTGALPTNGLGAAIRTVISSEATRAALTTAERDDFLARFKLFAKPGGYGVCKPGTGTSSVPCQRWVISSWAGRILVPAKASGAAVVRPFSFGSIASNQPVSCFDCSEASAVGTNTAKATAELMRIEIRRSMATY